MINNLSTMLVDSSTSAMLKKPAETSSYKPAKPLTTIPKKIVKLSYLLLLKNLTPILNSPNTSKPKFMNIPTKTDLMFFTLKTLMLSMMKIQLTLLTSLKILFKIKENKLKSMLALLPCLEKKELGLILALTLLKILKLLMSTLRATEPFSEEFKFMLL